jgi:hypothetical protein
MSNARPFSLLRFLQRQIGRRGLKFIFTGLAWLAAAVLLLEEWLWETGARLIQRWANAPWWLGFWGRLGVWLARLPTWAALLAFLLPSLILLPAKLIGLHALAQGHVFKGVATIVVAKLLGTALFARIFQLVKPQLLQWAWFAAAYARVMRWLAWAHAWVATHTPLAALRTRLARWREQVQQIWQRWQSLRLAKQKQGSSRAAEDAPRRCQTNHRKVSNIQRRLRWLRWRRGQAKPWAK